MASVMINISEADYVLLASATLNEYYANNLPEADLLNRICKAANKALAGMNPTVRASRKMGSQGASFDAEGPLDCLRGATEISPPGKGS